MKQHAIFLPVYIFKNKTAAEYSFFTANINQWNTIAIQTTDNWKVKLVVSVRNVTNTSKFLCSLDHDTTMTKNDI